MTRRDRRAAKKYQHERADKFGQRHFEKTVFFHEIPFVYPTAKVLACFARFKIDRIMVEANTNTNQRWFGYNLFIY